MTLLPSHDATDRPDLPEYPLGPYCSVPGCAELRESGGGHHVWRRSNATRSYWVQLSDGALVPNRVGLCWQHHRDVTGDIGGHAARIVLADGVNLTWETRHEEDGWDGWWVLYGRLKFAYDPYEVLHLTQLTMDGGEVPHETVVAPNGTVPDGIIEATSRVNAKTSIDFVEEVRHAVVDWLPEPTPGQPCPTCHRRVNHPKKPDSPKSKTVAYRVPLDDATTHDEIAEAAAIELGIHDKPHWRWSLNNYAYAVILQGGRLKETGG